MQLAENPATGNFVHIAKRQSLTSNVAAANGSHDAPVELMANANIAKRQALRAHSPLYNKS